MATIRISIDEHVKAKTEALFQKMGLTTTEAVNLFLLQCINTGGLPFTPVETVLNWESIDALQEEGGTRFKNTDELSDLWK